jgi:hypothetical protein
MCPPRRGARSFDWGRGSDDRTDMDWGSRPEAQHLQGWFPNSALGDFWREGSIDIDVNIEKDSWTAAFAMTHCSNCSFKNSLAGGCGLIFLPTLTDVAQGLR